jgi:FAD/FMN-containing dehydrogenase/Fe-S oxidoreductase
MSREIPYNYTSADDALVVSYLLGPAAWEAMERLRTQRVTGRSARLLLRVLAELFVLRRNPFVFQELLENAARRRRFATQIGHDLGVIRRSSGDNAEVRSVLAEVDRLTADLLVELQETPARRQHWRSALGAVVGAESVRFDPITLTAHATDATDWRLHLPVAVVFPQKEGQVAPLLLAIDQLGLKAIARGAGTGLTGGAVPLAPGCVVVNTECLNRIVSFGEIELGGATIPVVDAQAGVVTETAMHEAQSRGWVFATDPTSAWACTLGGNIAENAGGKMAVLWGTAVDNLVSWRMALPTGSNIVVERTEHPLRKIQPGDVLRFTVKNEAGALLKTVELTGAQLRKKGLWKDITNKALGGLPGLQKEGVDGVITGARFVLHRPYSHQATACLEFFSDDLEEASRVILALAEQFPDRGEETLLALEHFDEEYVEAIGYRAKSRRGGRPKAVLLIDVVGWTDAQLRRGQDRLRALAEPQSGTEVFFAAHPEEAAAYWADRKKLGAIARRTNAFKLNEDVVLPLHQLATFAGHIGAMNLDEEHHNQRAVAEGFRAALRSSAESDAALSGKVSGAASLFAAFEQRLLAADRHTLRAATPVAELKQSLVARFAGHAALEAALESVFRRERARLIVVATHMHAGDGNVHVNIPVFSNDREMMRRAQAAADRAMRRAVELGGVVSGEHGIGVTKIQYLEPERLAELNAHRAEMDPRGLMSPGQLTDPEMLSRVFTPSFNLLSLEARILQHDQLAVLAGKIQSCVRCGKCKPDCCVYDPARGVFFHPRNKNLAIGAVIEAILYDAQRSQSTRFDALRRLEEVADHCTICHKCLKPCPVDIDSGEVSELEREILKARGFKHTSLATRSALAFLKKSRNRKFQLGFRWGVLGVGSRVQRSAHAAFALLPHRGEWRHRFPFTLLAKPIPLAQGRPLPESLPVFGARQALLLSPENPVGQTVFYFPGCGSERLHGNVGRAAIYILLKAGVRVLVPPAGLCCGYPFGVNGETERQNGIELRNSIIFSQIREMFSYLNFDAVAVTCGTCADSLKALEAGKIFGASVTDAAAFALDAGLKCAPLGAVLYHKPCHDSFNGRAAQVIACAGGTPLIVPHCCGEAGTMAMSRPDISAKMFDRKEDALREVLTGHPATKTILTNCPSCLQGLGRQAALGITVSHVAVSLAEAAGGPDWAQELARLTGASEVVTF